MVGTQQWTEQKKIPEFTFKWGKRQQTKPSNRWYVSGKCLEEGKRLGEFGEIRQSAQGTVKRNNWVHPRGWGAETSWWMGRRAPGEGSQRGQCAWHTEGSLATAPGGTPSRSGWQRQRGGGCQPDTVGPCEPRSRLDLVQACEGKPLESCEYGRDTFQMSSLQQ